jgi:hypothetical protein
MSDKPETPKAAAAAAERHDASETLLTCTYKTDNTTFQGFGPWKTVTVNEQGKEPKDFMVFRSIDMHDGSKSYEARKDGKTYFDLIQPPGTRSPGDDSIMSMDVPAGKTLPPIQKGTQEYSDVVNQIHYKVNFDTCQVKPPMLVEKGEGYYQTVKRVNPDFSDEEVSRAAKHIKQAMGNKSTLHVGEEIKE